jgi:hypothetical protein
MTRDAKRKLKYSRNENFNLLPYVEWDRFVTQTGAQAGDFVFGNCFLSAMAPYVYSPDGRSLSIYVSECQI